MTMQVILQAGMPNNWMYNPNNRRSCEHCTCLSDETILCDGAYLCPHCADEYQAEREFWDALRRGTRELP